MSQFQPLPGVAYRIQNVKSGNYLELHSTNSVNVTPRKDSLRAQQWKFTRTAKNTYRIVNVAADPDNSHSALGIDSDFAGLVIGVKEEDVTPESWTVNISSDRDHCWITAAFQASDSNYLEMSETNGENLVRVAANNNDANQKWRIVLGLPTGFPRGIRRIRNAHTTTALTVRRWTLTMAPEETGRDQAWEVIGVGENLYELKQVDGAKYLSWDQLSDGVYKATLDSVPARWTILNYEQYDYGIFPTIPGGNYALTGQVNFPLHAPSQDHRGQIWLLESYTPDPSPTVPQPSQVISPPRRVSTVPGGQYIIENVGTGYTVLVSSTDYSAPVQAAATPSPISFGFFYQSPTSPFFQISHEGQLTIQPGPVGEYLRLGGSVLNRLWYLVEEPGKTEYYICSDVDGKRLAWGKPIRHKDFVNSQVFTTVEWVNGDSTQRWVLTPKARFVSDYV